MLQTDTETSQVSDIDLNPVEDQRIVTSEYSEVGKSECCYSYDGKSMKSRTFKDVSNRDVTIILLKREIESALLSLKEVQAEMVKLHDEKKQMWMSGKQSQESMKSLTTQVLTLEAAMSYYEKQSRLKMEAFSHRLNAFEKTVEEAGSQWCQTKEVFCYVFLHLLSQILLTQDVFAKIREIIEKKKRSGQILVFTT